MKTLKCLEFAILLILTTSIKLFCQEIQINSNFTSDTVLFPFEHIDQISSMTIEGNVHMHRDTSLVRVILEDDQGFQYMILESYPLICDDSVLTFEYHCDETCALDQLTPYSVIIQINNASLSLKSLYYSTDPKENANEQRYLAKRALDADKVKTMNERIKSSGMNWIASDNSLVAKYYSEKSVIFLNKKYNLQGFDYYQRGVFKYISSHENSADTNSLLPKSFDWRSKHDATTPGSKYDFGENGWITPLLQEQGSCGSCWVFGSISTVEAIMNLYYNDSLNYDLSEQDVLCNAIGDCDGGSAYYALGYIQLHGVIEENCLDYHGYDSTMSNCQDGLCSDPNSRVRITSQICINDTINDSLKIRLMTYGPLAISFEPDSHLMCLVGYQVDEKLLY